MARRNENIENNPMQSSGVTEIAGRNGPDPAYPPTFHAASETLSGLGMSFRSAKASATFC
jgi:hypothetical protein